ncbi:acyl-CoA synthetase (AMP-forming)/AMP-acid ligase II/acyl carrier protein [Kitasatospora gansuensis]|uniref:Acyl-CoA synthetase (AMP-forming)/AMP-acid ligase II/acyl carrier protein n=1 Tax=Kitasatospora gansuensis TaxID=258050 RepID=A0A7W7SDH3_9ACTN|nr:non-ribosomal peptide synthetase [Kitasatospora gansuensis]MBB4948272.1 acyl-CoA synthetase (AMP-forming)/AMP-acid ligase II/acyl carrier protein [Kitasatospora gansuensis]
MNRVPTSLLAVLAERAAATPTAPALLGPDGRSVDYRRLDGLVRATMARLAELGVERQDRVLVCAPNDLDGVVVQLAVMAGAVCYPVNPLLTEEEFGQALAMAEPSLVLTFAGSSASLLRATAGTSCAILEATPDPLGGPVELRFTGAGLDPLRPLAEPVADEALLLRTSGTTSAGKIVPLAQRHLLAGATASVLAYGLTPADRCLNVMPTFHIHGLVGSVITSLIAGSSVLLLPAFDAEQTLRALTESGATWFSAGPTIHRLLLDRLRERPADLSGLRFARSGTASLPTALREELELAYGAPVLETYGMSEAHQIASTLPSDGTPRAAGMVPTGSEVGLLDPDGTVRTTPGSTGEIVLRGANVIDRYFRLEDGAEAFVDGWLRTGDLGRLAEDGSIQLTGRIKEMINRGGEKISPYEVEEALLRHPGVRQAVAFGVADELFTQRVAAVVVLHEGAAVDEAGLRAHVAGLLAPFKVPSRVLVQAELELNALGKLVRADYSRRYATQFAEQAEQAAALAVEAVPALTARPQTPVEAAMAGLWAFALDRDRFGDVDEDFFTAGGESLSAMALLNGIKDAFDVDISPAGLFDELNTVERLAGAVTEALAGGAR